jgi:hypothetical protein
MADVAANHMDVWRSGAEGDLEGAALREVGDGDDEGGDQQQQRKEHGRPEQQWPDRHECRGRSAGRGELETPTGEVPIGGADKTLLVGGQPNRVGEGQATVGRIGYDPSRAIAGVGAPPVEVRADGHDDRV